MAIKLYLVLGMVMDRGRDVFQPVNIRDSNRQSLQKNLKATINPESCSAFRKGKSYGVA